MFAIPRCITDTDKILFLIEQLSQYLSNSDCYEAVDVQSELNAIILALKANSKEAKKKLSFIIAPTNMLQDISIDYGWGDEFIEISDEIDKCLAKLE